jgi:hypothetical protein
VGKCVKILLFFKLTFLNPFWIFGQAPANDLCDNAVDISDGSWYPGNTHFSTLECTDFRTGNCNTPQQSSNMCCGISGVEGTVWYKFTTPDAGPVNLEFTASTCNPVSFGITTTLQGFVLKKTICADNSTDIAVLCFDPTNANAFTNTFTATAGQEYYVQIDTDKNTLSSCNCTNPAATATCHSYCSFQVRIVLPAPTPIKDFKVKEVNNHVNIKWFYDWRDPYTKFSLVRKNFFSKDSVVLYSASLKDFEEKNNYFTYNDYSVETNSYYQYLLYANNERLLNSETIEVDYAQETYFNLVPNPSSGETKLLLKNTLGKGYVYNVFNPIGQIVKSGLTENIPNSETLINMSDLPPGMYYVNIALENKALQQALILE